MRRDHTKLPVVVGLSGLYHDSACAVVLGDTLAAAAQEERFTRRKFERAFPVLSFRWCLSHLGLAPEDVDLVVWYEHPVAKLSRQLSMGLLAHSNLSGLHRADPSLPFELIRSSLGYQGDVMAVPHHHAHAAGALAFAPRGDRSILTVDGVGEWTTTAYYHSTADRLEELASVEHPHSLGIFYAALTTFLGFRANSDEYKVMGLAAFGSADRFLPRMEALLQDRPGPGFWLDAERFGLRTDGSLSLETLAEALGCEPRTPGTELRPPHMDLASAAQRHLENTLVAKATWLIEQTAQPDLCLSGGVALNCVANARLRRETGARSISVPPAPHDAGSAVGAALLGAAHLGVSRTGAALASHAALGPYFSSNEAGRVLRALGIGSTPLTGDAWAEAIAARINDGAVVATAVGQMEFGPRALGQRSILADPRRPDMQDRLNRLIKHRESFRPFAPVVLYEQAADHFDLDQPSPYMLETFKVISNLPLPAVTHVDGTARVQTVEAHPPHLRALLSAFWKLTGCPILVNTSFNLNDEPIVCSPLDAIICFARSEIDVLVLEDHVVERSHLPKDLPEAIRLHQKKAGPPSGNLAYTFFA